MACVFTRACLWQESTATKPWEEAVENLSDDFEKEGRDLIKVAKLQVKDAVRLPASPARPFSRHV
jgi:hypothetical protein